MITPVMPATAETIFNQLNVPAEGRVWDARAYRNDCAWNTTVAAPLFPRIDMEKELAALEELKAQAAKAALISSGCICAESSLFGRGQGDDFCGKGDEYDATRLRSCSYSYFRREWKSYGN